MIIPTQPPSSYDGEDQDQTLPPPYQESAPSPQRPAGGRRSSSLYAPPVSTRSDLPREGGRESGPSPDYPNEKNLPLLPKEKEERPAQRAFDVFSSMVWGTPTASTSQSQNPASTSHTSLKRDPLNPAPDAFTRPAPRNYVYLPFQPMTMLGISSNITDGFPMIPPPINPEDERNAGKANPQHPFVSHDITEEDWLKFLADLKTVASTPNQAQKSFLARIFLGEVNEKDQRKQAIHFIDMWNHYFFQPRRMSIVLARGRQIFNGARNHHHRRHSIDQVRRRDADTTQTRDHRNRHRSRSTDSSSPSTSSASSIRSAISEPPEMPVPHTHEPLSGGPFAKGPSDEHGPGWVGNANYVADCSPGRAFGGPLPEMGRGRVLSRRGGLGGGGFGGHPDPIHPGWHGGRGGGGWGGGHGRCAPGVPGPSTVPSGGGEPWEYPDQKHAWKTHKQEWKHERRTEKRAWKAEKRGTKYEHRRMKRAMRHERRQRRLEARTMRYGGEESSRGVKPWKLIISYHGVRGGTGQS